MQAIETKYHGPTNTKGSRISARCEAKRIYVGYDHSLDIDDNHKAAAKALRDAMGWNTDNYGKMYGGHTKDGMAWVFAFDWLVIE